MYVRDGDIIVMRPGSRGNDHAGERFERGGAPENDLIGKGDELAMWRIVTPHRLPDTLIAAIAGRPLRELIEIPGYKGFDPVNGNDHARDWLSALGDAEVAYCRQVERGTLIAVHDVGESVLRTRSGSAR